jgi:hypothetical protein
MVKTYPCLGIVWKASLVGEVLFISRFAI